METKYLYGFFNDVLIIKFIGNLSFNGCYNFFTTIDELFSNVNFKEVFIDLSDTLYIDSTHIGIIAKIIKLTNQKLTKKVTIFSIKNEITDALKNLGIDKISIFLDNNSLNVDKNLNLNEIPKNEEINETSLAELIYKAHLELIDIDLNNYIKFKDLLEIIKSEIT